MDTGILKTVKTKIVHRTTQHSYSVILNVAK